MRAVKELWETQLNSFVQCQGNLYKYSLMPTMKINPAGTDIIQNDLDVSLCNWKQVRYVFLANCYASAVILITQAALCVLSTEWCLFCAFYSIHSEGEPLPFNTGICNVQAQVRLISS